MTSISIRHSPGLFLQISRPSRGCRLKLDLDDLGPENVFFPGLHLSNFRSILLSSASHATSVYLSLALSLSLSICMSVCLYVSPPIFYSLPLHVGSHAHKHKARPTVSFEALLLLNRIAVQSLRWPWMVENTRLPSGSSTIACVITTLVKRLQWWLLDSYVFSHSIIMFKCGRFYKCIYWPVVFLSIRSLVTA